MPREKHFVIASETDNSMVITPRRYSNNPNSELVLMKRVDPKEDKEKAERQCWVLTEENTLRTFYRNGDRHFFITEIGEDKPVQVQEFEGKITQTFVLKNSKIISRSSQLVLDISTDVSPGKSSKPKIYGPHDVVFVVDSSGSINEKDPKNWERLLQFMVSVVTSERLTVNPDNVRVGIVVYSKKARVDLHLKDSRSALDVSAVIEKLVYMNNRTNTADGLQMAHESVFQAANGSRPDAKRCLILITDGDPNENVDRTVPEAQKIKDDGIRIIPVAVSDNVNVDMLKKLSSADEVISAMGYDQLDSRVLDEMLDHTQGTAKRIDVITALDEEDKASQYWTIENV